MKGYKNLKQLITLSGVHQKNGRHLKPSDLGIINDAAIVYDDTSIIWCGATQDIEKVLDSKVTWQDGASYIITPELVDSHTHLIFSGDRAAEYAMRLNGADYQDIADAGGGILATVKSVREDNTDELFDKCCERIKRLSSYGIGTIEIKSGYGLNYETEKKLSLVIDKLKKHFFPEIQILNTFMAAHAVPKTYDKSDQYLKEVCVPLLKELTSKIKIDFVDIFHEQNYFSKEDVIYLYSEAKKLGINIKTHADEFNDNKGAVLACELGAVSCDHLLCTTSDGFRALSENETVATLLPGTGFFLGKPQANARALLDAGAKVSIASDYNPGSCHCDNLLLLASISAPTLKINQAELWSGITYNASHALGLTNQGALLKGMKPRFSIFKADSVDQITYNWGQNYFVNT
jgi:imidazolonepropionase